MAHKNFDLVFAKTCTNTHGSFAKGDTARGAFSEELVAQYVSLGILVERPKAASVDTPAAAPVEAAMQKPSQVATPKPTAAEQARPTLTKPLRGPSEMK